MVELALAIPVFIAVLLAVVDFGLYFNKRIVLQAAAYNYAKDAANASCASTNRQIIDDTVTALISNSTTTVTITSEAPSTTIPQNYQATIQYQPAAPSLLSIFTQGTTLYPITTTGVAHCP